MDAMTEVKTQLAKGIYIDNLNAMIRYCMQTAKTAEQPLVLYVLAQVFDDIVHAWDGLPVTVDSALEMERRIGPALQKVLSSADDEQSVQQELNSLLREFLS